MERTGLSDSSTIQRVTMGFILPGCVHVLQSSEELGRKGSGKRCFCQTLVFPNDVHKSQRSETLSLLPLDTGCDRDLPSRPLLLIHRREMRQHPLESHQRMRNKV